jgi:hypothetical protein
VANYSDTLIDAAGVVHEYNPALGSWVPQTLNGLEVTDTGPSGAANIETGPAGPIPATLGPGGQAITGQNGQPLFNRGGRGYGRGPGGASYGRPGGGPGYGRPGGASYGRPGGGPGYGPPPPPKVGL